MTTPAVCSRPSKRRAKKSIRGFNVAVPKGQANAAATDPDPIVVIWKEKMMFAINRMRVGLFLMVAVLIFAQEAQAWLRGRVEDAVLIERSELIVVGRLDKESIKYIPHRSKPGTGHSHEHHAILIIAETLKGKIEEKQVPIVIHYGLTPIVGGYIKKDSFMINLRGDRKDYPKDIIEIIDTGNSAHSDRPLVKDVGKDNLWFLRKRGGIHGEPSGKGKYSIEDPEELQPLSLKDYFLAYLSSAPKKAVAKQLKKNPNLARRIQRYLDHLEIQRILKIANPKTRTEKLLPYYLKRTSWGMKQEAREGIIACGKLSGACLRKVFDNPEHRKMRGDIILVWGKIGYKDCVGLLIDLLKEHDKFWARQKLAKDNWYSAKDPKVAARRREAHTEVYYSVYVLGQIGDHRAESAIRLTKRRWDVIPNGSQIAEACDAALKGLREKK